MNLKRQITNNTPSEDCSNFGENFEQNDYTSSSGYMKTHEKWTEDEVNHFALTLRMKN